MASSESKLSMESYTMVSGDGLHSYAQNSTYQKRVVDAAKEFLNKAIADNLDINNMINSNVFCIADVGCSTGPNTFIAVQNIIDAIENNLNTTINFQVFFNDHTENDFNTLFRSLPASRKYLAAGVPGSFHGPLFLKSTLHFVHASYALHWLSMVPRDIVDNKSPAWNKGSINSTGLVEEVTKAYRAQFKNDMDSFLNARAEEVVGGGLMVILISGLPDGVLMCKTAMGMVYDLVASCLLDMAKLGLTSEEKVDSFNLPIYFPPKKELESVIEENGNFSIEKVEIMTQTNKQQSLFSVKTITGMFRAISQDLISKHFGYDIIDKLFELIEKKVEENYETIVDDYNNPKNIDMFIMLKRKFN